MSRFVCFNLERLISRLFFALFQEYVIIFCLYYNDINFCLEVWGQSIAYLLVLILKLEPDLIAACSFFK